jgi:hypothetical protein
MCIRRGGFMGKKRSGHLSRRLSPVALRFTERHDGVWAGVSQRDGGGCAANRSTMQALAGSSARVTFRTTGSRCGAPS